MRRALLGGAALIVAVAALVLALGGTLDHTSGRDGGLAAARPRRDAPGPPRIGRTTAPVSLLSHGDPSAVTPAARRLVATLRATLRGAGPRVGALVYDLGDHRVLFALKPTVARPPASVEKLWTSTAVLRRLGPAARLHTAVLGTGHQRGHVWHGNLYLRGDGDPTFGEAGFNDVWNHGEGADAGKLVAALHARGIRRVSGRLYADESLFDRRRGGLITHYRPDVPDFGGQLSALTYDHGTTLAHFTPATFAAHEVALTLRADGIAVTAAPHSRRTPAGASVLTSVASPTMAQLLRLMNVPSDDFFGELLAKQLGVLYGRGGSISAGAAVISRTLAADYGLHPRILDGSGLGRADRSSPLQIVELLRDVWRTTTGAQLAASLPTTGVSGTVQTIGAHSPAQGRCEAKTGSLNFVTNLAGYCDARGAQQIAFAIFIDGPDNPTGFELESRMIGAVARY